MDDTPKTRKEIKGGKKWADKNIYSQKAVRAKEALIEKRQEKGIESSSSKTSASNHPRSQ
jgi:hypothetical protein